MKLFPEIRKRCEEANQPPWPNIVCPELPLLLEAFDLAIEKLNSAKTAMNYAYEDRCDYYYLNVKNDIENVLQKIQALSDGAK